MWKTNYRFPRQFLVFGLIGGLNTFIHSAVVVGLVESKLLPPVLANFCAFLIANQSSFFLNCRFTFQKPPALTLYGRFFLVSLASLIVTIGLSSYAEWMQWHYGVGLLLVIGVGPPLTFVLQKHWAFKLVDDKQPEEEKIKDSTNFRQFGLIVFCVGSLTAILALALTVTGLAPIDDHQFIRTIFQGKSFSAYVMPDIGRFFPLTAQEYAIAAKFFEPSPFLFQIINCTKILLCGSILFYCLSLTAASNLTIAVLWSVVLFSVGFANSVFRYHVGEINALILVLFFVWASLSINKASYTSSSRQNLVGLGGVAAMCVAFFYKEMIFVFAIAFSVAELVRWYRQKHAGLPRHLYLLLSAGISYIVIYGYWRAINTTGSYASYHSVGILDVARLFVLNDPFLVVVVLPITAFRVYLAIRDPRQHTIYDSFLVAASSYVTAYLALGIFNTYYLLPAYGFAVCGIAGLMASRLSGNLKTSTLFLTGVLALNTLPTAVSDMQNLKVISNNHYKFIQSLSEWILLNPLANSEPRNLVLNGVSPGKGIEIILSLQEYLTSFGVSKDAFNVKYTGISDNKIVSAAYGIDDEATYTSKIGDLLIFNPYQQIVLHPPLLTPSYREIYRSDSEWTFPRRSIYGWFEICVVDQYDCSSGRPGDTRYTGYAALLTTRSPAPIKSEWAPVRSPSYRVGQLQIGSRLRAGTSLQRDVSIVNTGEETWPANGALDRPMSVNLAYVWINSEGKVALEGNRSSFQEPIQQNDVAKVLVYLKTPELPGKYRLIISPVQEGIRWFYPENLSKKGKEIEIY